MLQQLEWEEKTVTRVSQCNKQAMHRGDVRCLQMQDCQVFKCGFLQY